MTEGTGVSVASQEKPKGLAIAGMVTGICGCIPCLSVLAMASAIVGIVLSAIALKKVKEGTGGGKGMATAGLVCGIVGVALWVFLLSIWGVAILGALTAFGAAAEQAAKHREDVMLLVRHLPYC